MTLLILSFHIILLNLIIYFVIDYSYLSVYLP